MGERRYYTANEALVGFQLEMASEDAETRWTEQMLLGLLAEHELAFTAITEDCTLKYTLQHVSALSVDTGIRKGSVYLNNPNLKVPAPFDLVAKVTAARVVALTGLTGVQIWNELTETVKDES